MILFLPENQKLLIKRKELLAKRLQFCFKTLGTYTMILLLRLDTGFIQHLLCHRYFGHNRIGCHRAHWRVAFMACGPTKKASLAETPLKNGILGVPWQIKQAANTKVVIIFSNIHRNSLYFFFRELQGKVQQLAFHFK